jgi:3-oxoacyl-[acyl-carrier protein] reductase
LELEDKVFVITGGSRGIGRAIALEAIKRGARVAFCARHLQPAAEAVLSEARRIAGPDRAIAVAADVSEEKDVEALFDAAIRSFGRVDVAVNNAGIYSAEGGLSVGSLILQVPTEDWDQVLGVNLTGAFLVSRRAVRQFLVQGTGGSIISVGSVSQDGGTGLVSYAVSKAGLLGLSNMIARQYGGMGIKAYTVVAGYLDTDMNKDAPEQFRRVLIDWSPHKRSGRVEEIASVVLFLASPRSALFNAASIYVTGGARDLPAYMIEAR